MELNRRSLQIGYSHGSYLFIGAKFLTSQHSLEVWEHDEVTNGQVWRIRRMRKPYERKPLWGVHCFDLGSHFVLILFPWCKGRKMLIKPSLYIFMRVYCTVMQPININIYILYISEYFKMFIWSLKEESKLPWLCCCCKSVSSLSFNSIIIKFSIDPFVYCSKYA